MSPFIVTTKRPLDLDHERSLPRSFARKLAVERAADAAVTSRRAVATLEEARDAVILAIHAALHEPWVDFDPVDDFPESGGSVGPLPDGTVIEVMPTTIPELAAALTVLVEDTPGLATDESIIAAYNASQEAIARG